MKPQNHSHRSTRDVGCVPSRKIRRQGKHHAFSRVELLMVCAALGLMAMAAAPALTLNRSESERMICFNNLRLIGGAVQTWAGDHNRQFPWRTPETDGGLLPSSGTRPGSAWFDYAFLSNHLVTPKILACPSDKGVNRAEEWDAFISVAFRANAVSYSISLDGSAEVPRAWLSADRNFSAGPGAGCSARINNISAYQIVDGLALARWTNGVVHEDFGHVLTADGSVEFTSTSRLQQILGERNLYSGTHFLKSR